MHNSTVCCSTLSYCVLCYTSLLYCVGSSLLFRQKLICLFVSRDKEVPAAETEATPPAPQEEVEVVAPATEEVAPAPVEEAPPAAEKEAVAPAEEPSAPGSSEDTPGRLARLLRLRHVSRRS